MLRDIRARKPQLPVLVLSAQASPEERVAGLNSGADDYVGKPFILAEVSARLAVVELQGWTLDAAVVGMRTGLTSGIWWVYYMLPLAAILHVRARSSGPTADR